MSSKITCPNTLHQVCSLPLPRKTALETQGRLGRFRLQRASDQTSVGEASYRRNHYCASAVVKVTVLRLKGAAHTWATARGLGAVKFHVKVPSRLPSTGDSGSAALLDPRSSNTPELRNVDTHKKDPHFMETSILMAYYMI